MGRFLNSDGLVGTLGFSPFAKIREMANGDLSGTQGLNVNNDDAKYKYYKIIWDLNMGEW